MKNCRFLLSTFFIIVGMIFIFSCIKEGSPSVSTSAKQSLENRTSGSACSPQSVYPILVGCVDYTRSIPINFALGLSLYSTGSTLYQLCPGVSFNVTYTFTVCNVGLTSQIHFIHNLDYNIADIIAACPALQAEIINQQALGNLVGFLDLLDFDISKQVEFSEAYIAALADKDEYLCELGGEFYDVKYIQNSCFKWVPFLDGSKERPIPAFKKVECNESVCCIRIGQYCVGGFLNGQPVLQGSGRSTYERTEGICPLDCTHECGDTDSI